MARPAHLHLRAPRDDQVAIDVVAVLGRDRAQHLERVGNYQYSPAMGMLIDQLWVR